MSEHGILALCKGLELVPKRLNNDTVNPRTQPPLPTVKAGYSLCQYLVLGILLDMGINGHRVTWRPRGAKGFNSFSINYCR